MRISSALGTIRGARILPAVADQLRASARAGTVHYSTMIEGNELPFIEAERAARRQLSADTRAKVELVNYVDALDLIDRRLAAGELSLTPDFLKELHAITTRGLGRENDPHFTPSHEGQWRDGTALVVDRITQQVMFQAPPAVEVPDRINSMFSWLERKLAVGTEPPFVLAGVTHYGITDIHPFADGNGRVARLFQTALLMKTEVLPDRMFSFERYYAEDRDAYYAALRSVREQTFSMEAWLRYFLRGLAEEYERVSATVTDLTSLVASGGNEPLRLTASQERALAALRISGRREFTRREYEDAARLSRTAAGDDVRELVRYGVLTPRGAGSAARYAFSAAVDRLAKNKRSGRPGSWTDVRIEHELREFLAERMAWPSPADFRAAGKGPLYLAASRAGGISRWRRTFGL
jgi:Fic family protein